jgi:hypothetical protein
MMKKKWMGLIVLGVLLPAIAQGAWDMTDQFGGGSTTATVHSWVDQLMTAQVYRYNYEITGSTININWFSVGLLDYLGLTGTKGTLATTGGLNPIIWDFMDTPPSSVAALFQPQITPNTVSYVLYFDSYKAPTVASAMVSGITSNQYYSLTGNVFTPIPEPATLALLALGMGLAARRK